jgi:8-oxo-dGTP diphosphatase
MADPIYNYCPTCATPLVDKSLSGRLHRSCPACTFVQFLDPKVVAVVVIEHAGRVLLGRRGVDPGKGGWSFVGGYVDRGEPVEAAAIREAKEETNLDVTLAGLLGVYSAPGHPHIVVAYRAQPTGGISDLTPQATEVAELVFFAPEVAPALVFPLDAAIWRDWQKARE